MLELSGLPVEWGIQNGAFRGQPGITGDRDPHPDKVPNNGVGTMADNSLPQNAPLMQAGQVLSKSHFSAAC